MEPLSKNIMIIDDDEDLRNLLSKVLYAAGFAVNSCSSIKDAFDQFLHSSPDLIILDLNMPEMDGFTFLKFRHLNKKLASIPVIILSASKNGKDIDKCLELGADLYIEKPFESRIILQKIRYIFHSQKRYIFIFKKSEMPLVNVFIEAELIEQGASKLKIESAVKLETGKPVELHCEDFIKREGTSFACRVDSRFIEMNEGLFRSVLGPIGLSVEALNLLEKWQMDISI